MWATLVAKLPRKYNIAVYAAATAAVLASATEVEDGSASPCRQDDEYDSQVLGGISSSCSTLSGIGNDGQRVALVHPIIHTDIGWEAFGRGMTNDKWLDEFPPKSRRLFFQSSLTTVAEKYRLVCADTVWRRTSTTGGLCDSGSSDWRKPVAMCGSLGSRCQEGWSTWGDDDDAIADDDNALTLLFMAYCHET